MKLDKVPISLSQQTCFLIVKRSIFQLYCFECEKLAYYHTTVDFLNSKPLIDYTLLYNVY